MSVYYNYGISIQNKNKEDTLIVSKGKIINFSNYGYLGCDPDDLLSYLKHNDSFHYGIFCGYEKNTTNSIIPAINEQAYRITNDFIINDEIELNHLLVLKNNTNNLRTNTIYKKYKPKENIYPKEICTIPEFISSIKTELKTNIIMQDIFNKLNITEKQFLELIEYYLNYYQDLYLYSDNSIIINESKKEYIDFLHANFSLIYNEFLRYIIVDGKILDGLDIDDLPSVAYTHPINFLTINNTSSNECEKYCDIIKGNWFNDVLIMDRKRNTDLTDYKNLTPPNFIF